MSTLEKLADDAVPLLLKWGPLLLPFAQGLEQGKISKETITELAKKAMTEASDAQMREELKG